MWKLCGCYFYGQDRAFKVHYITGVYWKGAYQTAKCGGGGGGGGGGGDLIQRPF